MKTTRNRTRTLMMLTTLAAVSSSHAAVIVTQGLSTPTSAALATYSTTNGVADAGVSRSITAANVNSVATPRSVAQTFQLSATTTVDNIWFQYTASAGTERTFNLKIYEVAAVNSTASSNWTDATLLVTRAVTVQFDAASDTSFFRIDFTGADAFTLAARNSGTTGYGLVIESDTTTTTHWNWRGADSAATHPNGRGYNDTGLTGQTFSAGGANVDWNFALNAIPEPSVALLGILGLPALLLRRKRV